MISLEQIKALNVKVQNALDVIVSLREENATLRVKLGDYEKKTQELEAMVSSFNRDQDEVENGILNILQQLDKLEEDFSVKSSDSSEEIVDVKETESAQQDENPVPASDIEEKSDAAEKSAVDQVSSEVSPTSPEPEVQTYEKSEPEAELDIF